MDGLRSTKIVCKVRLAGEVYLKVKRMKKLILLFAALSLLSSSCSHLNDPTHSSYATLTSFLRQENLYQTLGIDEIDVNFLSISDLKDYRPDNKIIHDRKLEAAYDFTISGGNKVYHSKAILVSNDNVVWQMKTLVIKEQSDSSKMVIKKTFIWDLSKAPVRSVSVTKVTKS